MGHAENDDELIGKRKVMQMIVELGSFRTPRNPLTTMSYDLSPNIMLPLHHVLQLSQSLTQFTIFTFSTHSNYITNYFS